MSTKPMFHWWAHKLMWEAIANYPEWLVGVRTCTEVKLEMVDKLVLAFGGRIDDDPVNACYACEAVRDKAIETGGTPIVRCTQCPLYWGEEELVYNCELGLYNRWQNAWNRRIPGLARQYALEICDLPLRANARELYDVKEFPFYGD